MMTSQEIRSKFLTYFKEQGHTVVASSPVIPAEDPTLLFANAGMNQFKDCFLGKEKRSYVRAASSQKCVRAGGKHNDLENVGFTQRHLTFFEMLGNFSFGDYFKKEALAFAWELLTKGYNLPIEKLYVTVYVKDDEAYEIWNKQIGVAADHIVRLGEKDNFWQMGDTGPCGPCSEIYVDRGERLGCGAANCAPGCDCDRFVEIWNNVFMQFNRQADGEFVPLKQVGVDTGMGLERLTMILQQKDTVYHIDTFAPLIAKIEVVSGKAYKTSSAQVQAAFHVLCDHVRSTSFMIADGAAPSNEGRGYVMRKIIRRAALFASKLSDDQTLFPELATVFINAFSNVYPELKKNETLIYKVLKSEIEKFTTNLLQGQAIFKKYADELIAAQKTVISGQQIFKLYDTYGFPPELTKVMAGERGLTVDEVGFEKEMAQQQAQSGKKEKGATAGLEVPEDVVTKFKGYETLQTTSKVLFKSIDGEFVWVVTAESPFYVESGGQVNDQGTVTINGQSYEVVDLKKLGDPYGNFSIAVKLQMPANIKAESAPIKVGDQALSKVYAGVRANTVKNHTATHMLQAALINILGSHVKQAGSVVQPDYLRFDFAHHEAMTKEQIEQVENLMNQKIQENIELEVSYCTLAEAQKKGVIAFFGEKYNADNVRVVRIPGFSAELCGGTHAERTGIIGAFKITSEVALATGVRRMVAITGPAAIAEFQQCFKSVKALSEQFKVKSEAVVEAVVKQQEQISALGHEIKNLKKELLKFQVPAYAAQIKLGKVPYLFLELNELGMDDLRALAAELEKVTPGFYFLVSKLNQNPVRYNLFASVSKAHQAACDVKKLSAELAQKMGIRGGGSSASFQGGGAGFEVAVLRDMVTQWIEVL